MKIDEREPEEIERHRERCQEGCARLGSCELVCSFDACNRGFSTDAWIERSGWTPYFCDPCPYLVCVLPAKASSTPPSPPDPLTRLSDPVGHIKSNTMASA